MNPESRAFALLLARAKRLQSRLTAREKRIFQAGLHASHAEEAFLTGDGLRSLAHFQSLERIVKELFPE
jgi:hypothetical protein